MFDIDSSLIPPTEPFFDPIAFQEGNAELKLANYALTQEQLEDMG